MRQGYPLSPFLFNIVANCLARMINCAQNKGLVPHLIENGIAILQYADDTIMCLKHDLNGPRNTKLLFFEVNRQERCLYINKGRKKDRATEYRLK